MHASARAPRLMTLAFAAFMAAGCEPGLAPAHADVQAVPAGQSRQADAASRRAPARRTAADSKVATADSVTLQFDVPPDFLTRAADGTFRYKAMQVGYFAAGSELVRTIEIPREQIEVSGRSGKMSIPLFPMPAGANQVNVRLRGLSSGAPGAWSEAVGPLTLPELETRSRVRAGARAPRNARAGTASPRRPAPRVRAITAQDVSRRPALEAALQPLLGPAFSQSDALACYTRVQDLAAAIVVSRKNGLPFVELCRIAQGPPPAPLNAALTKLRPSMDARGALKAAQPEARALLARPERSGAQPRGRTSR